MSIVYPKKVCARCGLNKRLRDFSPHKKTRDGRANVCRDCDQDRRDHVAHPSQRPKVVKGVCALCYGMAWRVVGEQCKCGLRRTNEQKEV